MRQSQKSATKNGGGVGGEIPKTEIREVDYTTQILARDMARAGGLDATASATAAVEACAGLWSRGFAVAEVAPVEAARVLTRDHLADIGRSLALRGGWLAVIELGRDAQVTLTPASSWTVTGPPDVGEWHYHATFTGPTSSRTRDLRPAEVIHISYARDQAHPWLDVSPLTAARSTARALANLENSLGDELAINVSQLLVTGLTEENEADRAQLEGLSRLKGKLGFLLGQVSAESGLVAPPTPTRIGHQIPESTVDIWNAAQAAIFNAYGVGGLFATDTTAAARREAYRAFIASTLSPLASKLASAAGAALPYGEVELSFHEMKSNDLAARSRSLKALVESGVDLAEARKLTGFAE